MGVMGIFRALFNHLTLMISLGVFYSVIVRYIPSKKWLKTVLSGLLFGTIAVLGILAPVRLEQGAIYDARSIVLSLAGIFGGPVAALVAAVMAAAARAAVGGVAAAVGIAVIAESTLLGLAYRRFYENSERFRAWPALWGFSMLVHVVMVAMQLALPAEIRWEVVQQIALPVLVLYSPVFVLLALVLGHQQEAAAARDAFIHERLLMRQLLDALPTPVTLRGVDGRYLLCNKPFAHYTGSTVEKILQSTTHEFLSPDIAEQIDRRDKELLENPGHQRFEIRLSCADGPARDILFDRSLMRDPEGRVIGIASVMTDVTEMRQMEERLRQSQKLEAVGRLAGGIAHDFNNMLSVIMAQTDEVLEALPEGSSLAADMEEIRRAVLRSSALTQQLLLFARKQDARPRRLDPVAVVRNSLNMLRRLIPESIGIAFEPSSDISPVFLDATHFEQVVANLLINARDAISGTGRIDIEIADVHCSSPQVGVPMALLPGDWVRLRVKDDGCGIAPENLEKIFDPFFTTKDTGKGTGLGLATVYGIVTQASGCIQVQSTPGQGTVFDIFFPACEGEAEHEDGPRRSTDELRQEISRMGSVSGNAVLVVEDEEANLRVVLRLFGRSGLAVFGASSPSKAMEIFRAHAGQIGLLVTDVVMPEKNGVELWHEMRKIKPNLRCVFMSGYTADVVSRDAIVEEGALFLGKPFDRASFLRVVHQALNRQPPDGDSPPQS